MHGHDEHTGRAPSFLASEIPVLPAKTCRYHVLPVPWETSVTYGRGTADGPAAILAASTQLEAFNGTDEPCRRGIHTRAPIDCNGTADEVLDRITGETERILDVEALPVLLGGEHTVTLGALYAFQRRSKKNFGILHFDAHADLRDRYEGNPLSHACVMRRVLDLGIPLFQVGVRALCREEHELRTRLALPRLDAPEAHDHDLDSIALPDAFPEQVYVSFDVDVFDASLMPATGTPVPGGLDWDMTVRILRRLLEGRYLAGCDVVEFAPLPGLHAPAFTAALLVYTLMGLDRTALHP